MDPSLKRILDTLNSRFDEFDRRLDDRDRVFADRTGTVDSRFASLETTIAAQASGIEVRLAGIEAQLPDLASSSVTTASDPRLDAIARVSADLELWRPSMEGALDDIQKVVQKLVKNMDRSVLDELPQCPGAASSPPASSASASAAGLCATSPSGHRLDMTTQDVGSGVVMTWTHVPANGMPHSTPSRVHSSEFRPPPVAIPLRPSLEPVYHPPPNPFHPPPAASQPTYHPQLPPPHYSSPTFNSSHPFPAIPNLNTYQDPHRSQPLSSRLPKLPFPTFDGTNPKRWRSLCEKYFATYAVDPLLWVGLVEHYMEGPAGIWYQSIAPQLPCTTWDSFCSLLHERFDRDQHEFLLRQLFNIRQQTSVSAYATAFSELVDQIKSYCPNSDPLFFPQCFIDGLRQDIKAIVLVQRPQNFDAAVRLALLQEEVGTLSCSIDYDSAAAAPSTASSTGQDGRPCYYYCGRNGRATCSSNLGCCQGLQARSGPLLQMQCQVE